MNPEVQALWVQALESGEYKQGHYMLRKVDRHGRIAGYCCLGVLCDLYHRETGKGEWADRFFEGKGLFLPADVMDWAGLSSTNPVLTVDGRTASATMHNDGDDWRRITPKSFAQIAQGIKDSL